MNAPRRRRTAVRWHVGPRAVRVRGVCSRCGRARVHALLAQHGARKFPGDRHVPRLTAACCMALHPAACPSFTREKHVFCRRLEASHRKSVRAQNVAGSALVWTRSVLYRLGTALARALVRYCIGSAWCWPERHCHPHHGSGAPRPRTAASPPGRRSRHAPGTAPWSLGQKMCYHR